MNGTAAVYTQAATAAVTTVTPETATAAASSQLKRLAETLDRHGVRSAADVGAQLRLLSQQLLQLQQGITAVPSAQQLAAAVDKCQTAETAAGLNEQTAAPAAADVAALERSYAAPAAAEASNAEEAGEMQPLTKKQRRGETKFDNRHNKTLI